MIERIGIVLLTLLLHATLFLAVAWAVERLGWVKRVAAREFLWRSAVLGSVASAVLQLGLAATQGGSLLTPLLQVSMPTAHERMQADTVSPQQSKATSAAPARIAQDTAPARSTGVRYPAAAEASAPAVPVPRTEDASLRAVAPVSAPLPALVARILPWLLAAWLAYAVWCGLRLLLAARALRRLQRDALELEASEWQDDAAQMARAFAVPVPSLRISTEIGSPMATLSGLILLPVWALPLPREQRRAMLAHELSHLLRGDPLWRLGLALWRGLLWPLPLSALALQRLDALAELECDAAAARVLGDGRPLAECLAHCLEQRLNPQFPAFAVAMAAPRSPLLQRAERLLEGAPMSAFPISLGNRLLPLAAVIVAALAVPAFVLSTSMAADSVRISRSDSQNTDCDTANGSCTSAHTHNGNTRISISSSGRKLEFESTGQVSFNETETAIESLSAGAKVSFEETVGGVTRKVEYVGADGGVSSRYWRDGKEQAFDTDAKAWVAAIVPQLLRESAVNVAERVARLYKRGGATAVLQEVALIKSDYSRGRHLGELLKKHELSAAELDLALAEVGKIGSDYERRQVLSATLANQQVAAPQLTKVLQSAGSIGSDYERAELLVQCAERIGRDAQVRRVWLEVADGIGSDYERRRSLEALLNRTRGDDVALLEILAAGGRIGSDFEQRSLLTGIAEKVDDVEKLAPHYAKAVAKIGSDYERREALLALLRKGSLQREGALAVLDAAAAIGSDFECREVLVELARHMPDDAAVRQRYLDVAAKLSKFEREQAEEAAGLVRG